jgi:hypothetical protein
MMRLPLEIAMEVGSFLDQPSLTICTAKLCRNGVEFVSRPSTDSAEVTTIQLHKLVALCCTASEAPLVDQEQANGISTEAIKRIDLCLARRTSAEKVVFVANLVKAYAKANTAFYSEIHRHYSLGSNLQFNNGPPSLAVEWHARAKSIDAVAFLLGQSLHTLDLRDAFSEVNDISALASCQALHTLSLSYTDVSDVSALASCQALRTLHLRRTQVSDVSALVSCQALHTLDLAYTDVSDVAALASCQALHILLLSGTSVSDVAALASCQALHTLHLDGTQVSDVSALASCQALQTIDLSNTHVSDVSALASCQTLHMLSLAHIQVADVSALASCQALHTLQLYDTDVSDVSALAACESLRYLLGCRDMLGYEAVARLLEERR